MGVKPFLVASAVMAIMGQRLIRMLCDECKVPDDPSDVDLRSIGLERGRIGGNTIYRAEGCPACSHSGYKGRKGVYELMEMSNDLREMAFTGKTTLEFAAKARTEGMVTLQEDGVRKVLSGLTTLQEVLRITHRSD